MKHLILITLTSMLLVACTKTVPIDSIVERQGIVYEINSQEPFTGVAESYWGNEQLAVRVNYKAGLIDGLHESYFENGQLEFRANIKAGMMDGLVVWYLETGQLESKINYIDDMLNGLYESYFENGQFGLPRVC